MEILSSVKTLGLNVLTRFKELDTGDTGRCPVFAVLRISIPK